MPLQQITAPVGEPIHLIDALGHIKQDAGMDDAHALATITAARRAAENKTWRRMLGARFKQSLDSFPGVGQFGVPWGATYTRPGNAIFLDCLPVLSVESIQYIDMAGVTRTVDQATYTVDYTSEPCRITPVFGQIWPIPLPQIGAAWVTFTAGFAAPIVADATANTVTIKGPWKTQSVGDAVRFSNSGGALPAPMAAATDYYVVGVISPGAYQVSATAGGSAIDLTDAGSGSSFIGEVPGDLLSWMRLRIGSMDIYREEMFVANRGKVAELPFVDGLLDAYGTW